MVTYLSVSINSSGYYLAIFEKSDIYLDNNDLDYSASR